MYKKLKAETNTYCKNNQEKKGGGEETRKRLDQ